MANIKFLLMVFALVFVMFSSHQALSEQDCHEDKEKLLTICWDTIKIDGAYVPPTRFCRYFVQKVDMACVCRVLNPADEVTTSVVKLVRLAHDCGKALPVGSKCGSKYLYIRAIFYITNV
jgi:hypothetical protein